MEAQKNPITAFVTNSFTENPYLAIMKSVFFGLTTIYFTSFLGVPFMVSLLLFYAAIMVSLGFSAGKVAYSLYPDGIEQRIRKFIPYYFNKSEKIRYISWNMVKSYKIDSDKTRGFDTYNYLKLYLKNSPRQIWITDQRNKDGFEKFKDAFVNVMEANKTLSIREMQNTDISLRDSRERSLTDNVKRKKSFYDTYFAKALTIAFILFGLGIIYFGVNYGMGMTNWIRIGIIIIPGIGYMVYRVFLESKE